MFNPLQSEVDARFQAVEAFFKATRKFDGSLAATANGLAFVHLYAAYEFTVRGAVRIAIDSINAHGHKMRDLSPSLLALYLDPELSSLRDVGRAKIWSARLKALDRAFSEDLLSLPNNADLPTDGTHYRHSHLIMIFKVFGITQSPVRRKRHLYRIDEVVVNRNKVAHGEETASDVGRRYTREDIIHIIGQMRSVCNSLISIFDHFCVDESRHKRT